MSSSDSDDAKGKNRQYAVVAEPRRGAQAAYRPQSAHQWNQQQQQAERDRVNVYHNELFTDGDVLGGDDAPQPSQPQAGVNRPGQARMQAQKNSLAQRRQERMQANIYQANEAVGRGMNSPMAGPRGGFQPSASGRVPPPPPPQQAFQGEGNVYGMASSYDPNEEEGAQRQVLPKQGGYGMPQQPRLDLSDVRSFLLAPGPRNGPVMCYIVRDKGSAKMYPKYNLFLDDGNKRFLLAARKRKKQTTSNYLMSLDYDDLGRDSDKYFGKLRANFVGTEFTVYDRGLKENKKAKDGEDNAARQELGCITYQYNVLGTRGPRKMTAVIPNVDATGRRVFRATHKDDDMLNRLKTGNGMDELVIMRNKPPRWNEELNAYCLNFNGRVTEASVKNFQLVADQDENHVILQFGKIGKNTFTMDFQWPISALQAFAICLSSFDNKLACE